MKKILLYAVGLLFAMQFSLPVFAQPFAGQSVGGPIVSPYLNLNNVNTNGVSDYFTLVLPQLQQQQQQQALQRQQYQIGQLQRAQAQTLAGTRGGNPIQAPQIRSTGHTTSFNNYSHYYSLSPGRRQ